jgi:hypothetical protein
VPSVVGVSQSTPAYATSGRLGENAIAVTPRSGAIPRAGRQLWPRSSLDHRLRTRGASSSPTRIRSVAGENATTSTPPFGPTLPTAAVPVRAPPPAAARTAAAARRRGNVDRIATNAI